MGNSVLRRQLGKILKEKGYGKLYTCSKWVVRKHLKAQRMRNLINFLTKVKVGMKFNEWGINHIVAEEPVPEWLTKVGIIPYGGFYDKASQVKYKNNYLSCGCGEYRSFTYQSEVKTKQEIIESFKEGFNDKNWGPSSVAVNYFALLEKGIDILTDDGFIVDNYHELIKLIK